MTLNTSSYYDAGYADGLAKAGDKIATGKAHIEYIYHQHVEANGNVISFSDAANYHSTTSGGCFCKTVYKQHVHTGTSSKSGGCYTRGYHTHTSRCGTTYTSHSHSSGCYTNEGPAPCNVAHLGHNADGSTCWHCSRCGDCHGGMGGYCSDCSGSRLTCGNRPLNSGRAYTCGNPINTYGLSCGKTAGSRYASEGVDYYVLSCNKTATTIESGYIVFD